MNQQDVDIRIAAIKGRRPSEVDFPMTVEEGTAPAPQSTPPNSIDVTVPSGQTREQQKANDEAQRNDRRGRIPDNYITPDGEGSEPVKIGSVILRKSSLIGFEKSFTKDASDYQAVLEDGTIINSVHEIVKQVHAEAYRIKVSKQEAKS